MATTITAGDEEGNNSSLIGKKSIDSSSSLLSTIQTQINNENNLDKKELQKDKGIKLKSESVFKYTDRDNHIYESILLNEIPVFLNISNNGEIKFTDEFVETTRILNLLLLKNIHIHHIHLKILKK